MKTGIYTEGREWEPHEKSIFLGVDAEKFHDDVTKYTNVAVDAVARAYDATRQFVGKRWYLVAVPIALSIGLVIHTTLMAAMPDVEVTVETAKKRKKNFVDYMIKYKNVVEQKAQEAAGSTFGTLDDKVDYTEAKK